MKILHVCRSDLDGGAARAAYRIHRGCLEQGIYSRMIVLKKLSDDFTVIRLIEPLFTKFIRQIKNSLDNILKTRYFHINIPWSLNWLSNKLLVDFINFSDYDVIHLHWVNASCLSIEDIGRIKKPIIWTLHDTWAFTGGCHYFGSCRKFQCECGNCEQLGSVAHVAIDIARKCFFRKRRAYNKSSIFIVAPSKWMQDCVKESALFLNNLVKVIPNCLDLKIYHVINKQMARSLFNLPVYAKIIMFGALQTDDPRKGRDLLFNALQKQNLISDNIVLLILGAGEPTEKINMPYSIIYTGKIHDDVALSLLYNCADVFLAPSREDNLPNTVLEAMACGTPCVAFNIGGMSDLIDHKVNGYLADPFDTNDLIKGIEFVLNEENPKKMSLNARQKIEGSFSVKKVIDQYCEFYRNI